MYNRNPNSNQIYVPIKLIRGKKTVRTKALLDSGATSNFLSPRLIKKCSIPIKELPRRIELTNMDETRNKIGYITHEAHLRMKIQDHEQITRFLIADLGADDAVIGIGWLREHKPEINWENEALTFPNCGPSCKKERRQTKDSLRRGNDIPKIETTEEEEDDGECAMDPLDLEEVMERIKASSTLSSRIAEEHQIKEGEKTFEELVPKEFRHFKDVFSKEKAERMPTRKPFDHAVNLEEGARPTRSPIYPISPKERGALKEFLDENLRKGYIQKSNSEYAAPFFFAKKKDGGLRPIQDYRKLNKITIKDKFPLPLSQQLLDHLSGASVFSTLDLRWGYENVRIREGDEKKLAFVTEFGLYEPTVMFFGMCNAPATFQRMMNEIFHDLINKYVVIYLDDIFIFSRDREEHVRHVQEVLKRIRENDLFCKPEKCKFFQKKIEYLGHIISEGHVEMDTTKVQAILDWPTPRRMKDVQKFLGFANFYRRFIRDFSKMAKPLTSLTKKEVKWFWGDDQQQAFDALKKAFTTTPIRIMPDPSKPYIIECDASDFATGAILSQRDDEGKTHPIAFQSKSMNDAERNYEIYDKELLAIIRALEEWRHHLEGAEHRVTILTDHKNLEYFESARTLTRRQARWSLFLTRFDFEIQHRPGRLGGKPDLLSRRVDHEPTEKDNKGQVLLKPEVFKAKAMKRGHGNILDDHPILKRIRASNAIDSSVRVALETIQNKAPRKLRKGLEDWNTEDGLILYRGKVYVPNDQNIRRELVQLHHDAPHAGHTGIFKTAELISRNYWWPGMTTYIKRYVESCDRCLRKKNFTRKPPGPLQTISTHERPWETITNDFIVQLPESRGKDAIWVVADHTLKEAHFIPITSDIDTEQTIDLYLNHVWKLHGLPKKMISDRGPQFVSKLMKGLFERLGIEGATSTAYHPQTDGQSERINQELEQYLRIFCNYRQDDWADYISMAEFAYNNHTHSTTKHSPFYASRGYHPHTIISQINSSSVPRADELVDRIQQLHDEIQSALKLSQERIKGYYDNQHTETLNIEEGSLVWLDAKNVTTTAPSKKLADRRLGPYKVLKKISPLNYKLELPPKLRIHPVFHVGLLYPHKPDKIKGRTPEPPPPIEVEGEEEYEVEKLIDARLWRNQKQYLVKWLDYPDSDNSWEPLKNLTHSEDAITNFHNRHPDFQWKPRRRHGSSSRVSGEP